MIRNWEQKDVAPCDMASKYLMNRLERFLPAVMTAALLMLIVQIFACEGPGDAVMRIIEFFVQISFISQLVPFMTLGAGGVFWFLSASVIIRNQTAGALCTCLMAVEYINNNASLIIANSDQIIEVDYTKVIDYFIKINADAGVITFPSIHPRWSYARKSGNDVIEVAEKRPLSKDAIAGFYYFKQGSDFVQAAKKALIKQNNLDGKYYISSSINELILKGKKIGYYDIAKE